jgi:hypothetical protein
VDDRDAVLRAAGALRAAVRAGRGVVEASIGAAGVGNLLSSRADFDFYRAVPAGGYTKGLPAAQRTDVGSGDIPPETLGADFFPYRPFWLFRQPPRAAAAREPGRGAATRGTAAATRGPAAAPSTAPAASTRGPAASAEPDPSPGEEPPPEEPEEPEEAAQPPRAKAR